MRYLIEVRLSSREFISLTTECPVGIWRSVNGADYCAEFDRASDADRVFACANRRGYPISHIKGADKGSPTADL